MRIQRVFLGVDQPALRTAAEWLIDRAANGKTANLERTIVVLPGGRAGRRLLEILVDVSEQRGLMLSPPKIETVGNLPEQLYDLKKPFASELTQQLAWAQVLRRADQARLATIIPDPPQPDDVPRWLELGKMIGLQHTQLAADGFDFEYVGRVGANLEGFTEELRWRTMFRLQEAYLTLLDSFQLWDRQTARLFAIREKLCRTDHDIVLIGTVDINNALRHMLDQVADHVTALVYAPEEWAERFDEHGCLLPSAWENVEIPLQTDQVELVEGHSEQADAVVTRIAAFAGRYRADEITIGVPDEKIVPALQRRLEEFSLPCRFGPGRPITTTGPYSLLVVITNLLEGQRFADLAALVRHPDAYVWLTSQLGEADWLTILDRFQGDHLPTSLANEKGWLGDDRHPANVRQIYTKVAELLRDLRGPDQPLDVWTPQVISLLMAIYGQRSLNRHVEPERVTLTACERLHEFLQHHRTVPEALSLRVPGAAAIRFLLDDAAGERIAEVVNQAAMELLGWLELTLDDAPALIVTSFNEGFVPDSVNADLFLPNSLRKHLGLMDNARRFARDTYSLATLVESKKSLHLIVGRRNADRDPMIPSRLLFAADRETIARRVLAFFAPPRSVVATRLIPKSLVPREGAADFPIPLPRADDNAWPVLSVTALRAYLACPYRFYLRHVLGLKTLRDDAVELDGAAFGNLLHDIVKWFGTSPQRDSADPEELRRVLQKELRESAATKYGRHPPAAVDIQLKQLQMRLDAFADTQAAWVAQGWRIKHVEVPGEKVPVAVINVDGTPVQIVGRIDRIDFRESTGEWAVLDYKTSDAGTPPEKTHMQAGEWIDLQLPLYRHFVRTTEKTSGSIHLGYILLPKDVSNAKLALAGWTEAELAAADEVARDVVRRIRRHEFWPPTDPPPAFSEDFAAICQDDVFDKWRPS